MTVPGARDVALGALIDIGSGGRANIVVPSWLERTRLSARDRSFVTELVYGTVRMQRACDWLIDRHVRTRAGRLDPSVRAGLRMGAYQLAFLHTPAHAAVSSTVDAVGGRGRGLVNAVLRKVAGDVDAGVSWPDEATRLSYPDWIVERFSADLGVGAARACLEQMNEPARATARADGYIQDEASQQVGVALADGLSGGSVVADLCAAPGGKATFVAYGDGGPASPGVRPSLVIALDIDAIRARLIVENAARLGLPNVATVVADGLAPPLRPGCLDRVLVDAPCTGLGVLRRRPDARWRARPEDVDRLAGVQRSLLAAALLLVKPGGLLIYSVCTLTTTETVAVDDWLASTYPWAEAVPLPVGPAWEPAGRGARILPQAAGTDGMFMVAVRVPPAR